MKIIRNSLLPVGEKLGAINLFGILFVKKGVVITTQLLNHEKIHSQQMKELLYLPFYLLYIIEWLIKLFFYKGNSFKAYSNISFEKEAYTNADAVDYIKNRRRFAQWKKF